MYPRMETGGIVKFAHISVFVFCCTLLWSVGAGASPAAGSGKTIQEKFAALEAASGGRLGVTMLDAGGGVVVAYRGSERFPLCSTFKMMLTAAILKRSETEPGLLERRIVYTKDALISRSPVTEKHVAEGMSVADLCAATMKYSDNAAANLLLELLGVPEGLTVFARSIGDPSFRLDLWETALNEALPGDERDTTTPESMAHSLYKIAFGDVLPVPQRELLLDWLKGNTTGNAAIRAGVPEGWIVGDKTGSGSYGTTNDIAVLWPVDGQPWVLAVYFTQHTPDALARRDVIAEATRLVIEHLYRLPHSQMLSYKRTFYYCDMF